MEAQQQAVIDKIKADAIEKDIEYTQYVELATKALQEGYSEQTTLNLVRARYRQALEEAAKQQEDANKGKSSASSSANKSELVAAIKEGVSGVNVHTTVNVNDLGNGIDRSNSIINSGTLQRGIRDGVNEQK